MKGTGAKCNVCLGSCVSTRAKFPVAPVESAPMLLNGVGSGRSPQRRPGAEPLVRESEGHSPLKLKRNKMGNQRGTFTFASPNQNVGGTCPPPPIIAVPALQAHPLGTVSRCYCLVLTDALYPSHPGDHAAQLQPLIVLQ